MGRSGGREEQIGVSVRTEEWGRGVTPVSSLPPVVQNGRRGRVGRREGGWSREWVRRRGGGFYHLKGGPGGRRRRGRGRGDGFSWGRGCRLAHQVRCLSLAPCVTGLGRTVCPRSSMALVVQAGHSPEEGLMPQPVPARPRVSGPPRGSD